MVTLDVLFYQLASLSSSDKLSRNGIYPLTAFGANKPPSARSRAISPEMAESVKSVTPEPTDIEPRKIINMMCDVKSKEESCDLLLTIVLRMDDKMNRQLTSCISPGDNPQLLAEELVHYGFINEIDREKIANLIEDSLQNVSTTTSGDSSPTHSPHSHHHHHHHPHAFPAALAAYPVLAPVPLVAAPAPAQQIVPVTLPPATANQVPMHSTS